MIERAPVLIVAEAGVNHNGSLALALRLVDAAAEAGANVVKFQTWKTENVVTTTAAKVSYQLRRPEDLETQFEMLKKLELPYEDFAKLNVHCESRHIAFMSTADEIESATFLNDLVKVFKVGSAELTDLPYLRKLAQFGKPIILSTGMGTLAEVEAAIAALVGAGLEKERLTILHCNSQYPTPYSDANLRAMCTIRDALGVAVGYSDHTLGVEVAIAAVALGACVIEKHLTLDRTLDGPDHRSSLEPQEFQAMVRGIRNIEQALGDGIKCPSRSEVQNIPVVRKSIVASRVICAGEVFGEHNLVVKRPATGLSPALWDLVVGRRAPRSFVADEPIDI